MKIDLFADLSDSQCELLFECILHAIESNSGIGFRAYDQGHPDYLDGAAQRQPPEYAMDEASTDLFQMMRELSLRLADVHPSLIHTKFGLTTWPEFCKKAVHHYQSPTHSFTPLYERQ